MPLIQPDIGGEDGPGPGTGGSKAVNRMRRPPAFSWTGGRLTGGRRWTDGRAEMSDCMRRPPAFSRTGGRLTGGAFGGGGEALFLKETCKKWADGMVMCGDDC